MLNLLLALLWFVLAGYLYWREMGANWNAGTPIPFSVAAFILGIYNIVRWWTIRIARSQKNPTEQVQHRRPLRRASDDLPAPDPNFIFTDPPPAQPQSPGPPGSTGITPENKAPGFSS